MSERQRYGVLLANTGSPSAPNKREIKRFLGRFLMDKRIAPGNRFFWRLLLYGHILPLRGKRNLARYEAIWQKDGNPFYVTHEKLVSGLNKTLNQHFDCDLVVSCGFSFSDPDITKSMHYLQKQGCKQVLILPLYPQSAHSTTGSVYDAIERASAKLKWDVECHLIDNYYDNSTYIRALAASVLHAGFDINSNDRILFSYHSIPLADIERGDTYDLQVQSTSFAVAKELGLNEAQWALSYQCRFDRGREWLKPYTNDVLSMWASKAQGRVFIICPGFAVDCLETLYDVLLEQKPHYLDACRAADRDANDEDFVYVPCLDKSKAHLSVLKDVLTPYIEEMCDDEKN